MSGRKKVILNEIPGLGYKEIMQTIIENSTEEGCKNIFTNGGIDMCPSDIFGDVIDKEEESENCNYKNIKCTECWYKAIEKINARRNKL